MRCALSLFGNARALNDPEAQPSLEVGGDLGAADEGVEGLGERRLVEVGGGGELVGGEARMEGEGGEDLPFGGGGDGAGSCPQELEELGLESADTGERVGAQGRSRVEVEAGAGGGDDDAAG